MPDTLSLDAPAVPFTQYLLPDGRTKKVWIERPEDICRKAKDIIDAGHRFEIEVLTTGHVSATIHHIEDEEDIDIVVVENGPAVPVEIDRMVKRFHAALSRARTALGEKR